MVSDMGTSSCPAVVWVQMVWHHGGPALQGCRYGRIRSDCRGGVRDSGRKPSGPRISGQVNNMFP
ncbi:hypothetical protein JCM14469_12400 [Desulfatiferula olefinivorans]